MFVVSTQSFDLIYDSWDGHVIDSIPKVDVLINRTAYKFISLIRYRLQKLVGIECLAGEE